VRNSAGLRVGRAGAALGAVIALAAACTSPAPSPPPPVPIASASQEATTTPTTPRPGPTGQARLDQDLREAAWDNDVRQARALIRRGAEVNAKDETEQSAYLIATSEGYLDLLNLTLQHGADVDSKDSFNGTGLIRAADRGHADIAGRLIQAGIEIDHVNNLGWTALHEAIILGGGSGRYVTTVQVLVAAGADVRLPSRRDQVAPLAHAQAKGFDEIAEVLQAALDSKDGSAQADTRRLLAAADDGDVTGVAIALRGGAELEARDERERTALLRAVTKDRLAAARVLVYLGANPDALDDRHDTPWLVTGVTGSVAMVEVLLPANPDLTIRNRFGGVSIIPASERGHVDYVRRVVRPTST